jgi:hypothetical protein
LSLVLTPPSGKQFVDVTFASYGLPTGSFTGGANSCVPNFSPTGSCNAINSVEKIRNVFKDKTSTTSMMVNDAAFGGDPCPSSSPTGVGNRRLYVALKTANIVSGATTVKVRRGMVPFRTLGLPESVVEDGYGMRFNYAVTEPLATDSYQQDGGAITITDASHTIAQYVHYVIFSSGPDRAGAYTSSGVQPFSCPTNQLDTENCNTDSDSGATYRYTEMSSAVGPTHFDDYLKYYTSTETPLWRVSDAGGFDIEQMNSGKVGIGMDPNTTSALLQVNGTVRANSDAYAQTLCDADGANCDLGGGDIGKTGSGDEKLQCPRASDPVTYKYISEIKNGHVTCTDTPIIKCPDDSQYITGVDSSGQIHCAAIVGCHLTNVPICGGDYTYTLPAAVQGATNTSSVFGTSYQQSFVCNSNGVWQSTGSTGYCDCDEVTDETQNYSCNSQQPRVGTTKDLNSGRGWWDGNWTRTHSHLCSPTEKDTYSGWTKDCTCKDYLGYTASQGCGTGYTGTQTRSEDWVCDSSSSGHYTNWTAWSGTCTCNSSTPNQTSTQTCSQAGYGAGYNSGNVKTTKAWICDSSTSGHWGSPTVTDTCTCSAVKDTPYTTGCTAPEVGTLTYQSTFNCTTNSWDPPQLIADNCGMPVYYWRSKTGASAPTNNPTGYAQGTTCTSPGASSPCYSAAGGGKYYNYATCQCE